MKRERHYTEEEAARLEMLRKQKTEIQAEINRISRAETMREARRRAAEKAQRPKKAKKLYRELTAEERRAYWRETQRKSREKRRGGEPS